MATKSLTAGAIVAGSLTSFRFIASKETGERYTIATVDSADYGKVNILVGSADAYDFKTMLSLKGQGVEVTAKCSSAVKGKERFSNVEWGLG